MRYRSIYCFARRYTSTRSQVLRPSFNEIFPQKRMVNRILFELDSRLSFGKLYPLFELAYNNVDSEDIPVTSGITASDVMVMKKVLEKVRSRTKSVNRHLLKLENVLLDKAAEMGNNDAVSLLAFDVLKDPSKNTSDDVLHAKLLIKDLYKRKHHLTMKLTGDLALKAGDNSQAETYYRRFLELESDTFLAGEVYGQLGQFSFHKTDLIPAERYFLKSIQYSPLEYSVHSYFYLAQIYMNSDPLKARTLMENCATQGYKESFKALGFLEMNYFENLYKAQEWFKLGMELFELECFIGYFDCCALLGEWALANKCFKSLEKIAENNSHYKSLVKQVVEARHDKVKRALAYSPGPFPKREVVQNASKKAPQISKENKWNL